MYVTSRNPTECRVRRLFPIVSYNLPNEPFSLTFHETRGQLFHTVPQLWKLDTVIYTMLEENESDVVGVEGACDMSQPRNNPQLRT